MKRGFVTSRLVWGAALLLSAVVCGSPAWGQMVLTPGDQAPILFGHDIEGNYVNIQWGESKATLVNFWATWCAPCRLEMPAIQELVDRRGKDGLAVYGILVGPHNLTEVNEFLDEIGVKYRIVQTQPNVLLTWNALALLPTSYLIRGDGTIARRYVGATPAGLEGLLQDVENVLDDKPLGTMPRPETKPDTASPEP
jgi:thiol-disulfide isomerase/thioredoxin